VEASKDDQRVIHRYCPNVQDGTKRAIPLGLLVIVTVPLWWDARLVRAQRTLKANEISCFILWPPQHHYIL